MGKFKDFFAAVNCTNPQIMLTICFYCKLIFCITIKFMKKITCERYLFASGPSCLKQGYR